MGKGPTKNEIVDMIVENHGVNKINTSRIVAYLTRAIMAELKDKKEVYIENFGTFYIKSKKNNGFKVNVLAFKPDNEAVRYFLDDKVCFNYKLFADMEPNSRNIYENKEKD